MTKDQSKWHKQLRGAVTEETTRVGTRLVEVVLLGGWARKLDVVNTRRRETVRKGDLDHG